MAKPKKADVVEALEKAGVEFDAEATLEELMPLYEKLPAQNTGNDSDDEESDPKAKASVYNARGQFVRTYTKEVHGKEYKDLAKQYATKIGGTVK